MIRCDILNPEQGNEVAINALADTLGELLVKSWDKDGKDVYGKPFDLNVLALINSWLTGSLKVFVAYDNEKPIGFALGINFRPILYNLNILQIETWYTETDEVEHALADYIASAVKFLGIEEVRFLKPRAKASVKLNGWEEKEPLDLCRLVKK